MGKFLKDVELASETKLFGARLKLLRLMHDRSQESLGALAFPGDKNAGKLISQIEGGTKAVTSAEKDRLIEIFPELSSGSPDSNDLGSRQNILITREKFTDDQRDFLAENVGRYTMWFLNARHTPMFRNDELERTWSENIAKGISYSLVWDFSHDSGLLWQDFEAFIGKAASVLKELEAVENSQEELDGVKYCDLSGRRVAMANHGPDRISGIDVYATFDSKPLVVEAGGQDFDVEDMYEKARGFFKSNTRFRFHDIIAEAQLPASCEGIWRNASIMDATTLVYLPGDYARPVVDYEMREVTSGHHSVALIPDTHLFVGETTARKIADLIKAFENYVSRKEEP